ncbi:glycosyltransferase [Companilactobacillus insicii]|uniref:glycosyltransferase n=1 Tax=Companilactobacillus insicii TaxID=1732567 RepID=UPI000F770A18|nr:glycosyltransferase [Companilactobacillus insicii]
MPNKNVYFVASNPFNPDPRAEKQMITLREANYNVSGIGWDRESSKDYIYEMSNSIRIQEIGVKSSFGSGLKNILPLIKFNIKLFMKLLKNRKKIDIIQSVNLDTGFTSLIFSKLFRKKLVYDIYDYYADAFPVPNKAKGIVKKIENVIISQSDLTILPIDCRREQISGSKPKKLEIIYNTPNYQNNGGLDKYFSKYVPGKINISFVGALVPDRFLEQIVNVAQTRDDIVLHIAGFGSESIVNSIKNSDSVNVNFYGKVPYCDGLAISNISDLMIAIYNPEVSNHKYSAPNKFYESLFLGKPIVVANNTGIDTLVRDNGVGYAIDYSVESFQKLISSLDSSVLKNFKSGNQKLYNDEFSWEKMTKRILSAYECL